MNASQFEDSVEMKNTLKMKSGIVPAASNPVVVGWLGDSFNVCVASPPEKGRANRELLKLLEDGLQLQASDIAIVAGAGSQLNTVEIQGCTMSDHREKVGGGGVRP